MIIRQGEKPAGTAPGLDSDGNEDDRSHTAVGWERAHAVVDLFDPAHGTLREGLPRPATIYGAGMTEDGEGRRSRGAVAPLAEALGIAVDTETTGGWHFTHTPELVLPEDHDGVVEN